MVIATGSPLGELIERILPGASEDSLAQNLLYPILDPKYRGPKKVNNSYTGYVAGQCWTPNTTNTTNKQLLGINRHIFTEKVSSFRLVYPNFFVPNTTRVETGSGAPAGIRSKFATRRNGPLTDITFSNSVQGTIPNNSFIITDPINVERDVGDVLFDLPFFESAGGIIFSWTNAQDFTNGERVRYAVSGLTAADMTWAGVNSTDYGNKYAPIAIIGATTKRSVAILGDSKQSGNGDRYNNDSGDIGETARSIGRAGYPYSKLSADGDRAVAFLASNANRLAIAAYASDIIVGYGTNDISNGRTAAQLITDLQSIAALFPDKRKFVCTLTPTSTSTDNWASLANQTATFGTEKATVNDAIRAGLTGYDDFFEISDVVSSGRNSGKFGVDPSGKIDYWLAADVVHLGERGYVRIQDSGVVKI